MNKIILSLIITYLLVISTLLQSQTNVREKKDKSKLLNTLVAPEKLLINKCLSIDNFILSEEELAKLNTKEKKILRNFFFAKYGYTFKDLELATYFKQYTWYIPKYKNVDSLLNYYDKENIDLIRIVEKEKMVSPLNETNFCNLLSGCWQYGNTAVASGYDDRFVFDNRDKSFVMYTNQMDEKNKLLSYSGFFTINKTKLELEIRTKTFLETKTSKEKIVNLDKNYEYKTVTVNAISCYSDRDSITKTYFKINGRLYWKYSNDLESCH